jgi:predicted TIM-barrel fold metal-dependent hydrolase
MFKLPLLVSPDDHVESPAHTWKDRLPKKYLEAGPRVVRLRGRADLLNKNRFIEDPDGHPTDVWFYEDTQTALIRAANSAGWNRLEVGALPTTFDEIRNACYEPKARLVDMDTAGIAASVCYPNMFVDFCGQRFSLGKDKALGFACIQAYNDFIVEEWSAGSGGRLVPMGLVPLWDADLAAGEVQRLADRGVTTISFSEAPHLLGLPSIFSGFWEPLLRACNETRMVMSLHVGTGGFPAIAKDSPAAIYHNAAALASGNALLDWLFSGAFSRYPDLKICMAESQIGWIPYVLHRADWVYEEMAGEGFTDIDKSATPYPPSYYFKHHVFVAFFRDPVGLGLLDQIGVDNVMFETDYPHQDTMWPECHSSAAEMVAGLEPGVASKILAENASRLFRIELEEGRAS